MRWRRESLEILAIQLLSNFSAVLSGIGYIYCVTHGGDGSEAWKPETWRPLVQWAVIGSTGTAFFSIPLVLAAFSPLKQALERKNDLDPIVRRLARSHAAELPMRMLLGVALAWLVGAAGIPIWLAAAHVGNRTFTLEMTTLTGVSGILAVMNFYYAIELWTRRRVMPQLGPTDERLLRLLPFPRPRIWMKLVLLVVTTCAIPIVCLGLVRQAWGYMLAAFLVFAAGQIWAILRSVSDPIRDLLAQMRRISEGDLAAHVDPFSLDEIGEMSEAFNEMVAGLRRAAFVKETFGRYVSPAVAEEILRGGVALGGEKREVTVLFSDIRDFTAMSEAKAPEEVVRFLNRYFDRMVGVLIAHGATVDKFVGDAIMATFGVPIGAGDDPRRAVRAGLAMLAELEAFNAERAGEGQPPIAIGIGIHTGQVIAGNVGSARKLEYTVIGDTVNTASRIETATKTVGAPLLVSDSTWNRVSDEFEAEATAPVEVKGKREALKLWKVTRRTRVSTTGNLVARA